MKKRAFLICFSLITIAVPAFSGNRFIVHTVSTTTAEAVCARHGLAVVEGLDAADTVYLASASDMFTPDQVIADLSADPEVVNVEADKQVSIPENGAISHASLNQSTTAILDQIGARFPVSYFGQTLPAFYALQPALFRLNIPGAQQLLGARGAGVVAIIDTGIDPNHPVLKDSIVAGFDFTRNLAGVPSEFADLTQSTTAILDQSTTAILDQSTTAILDALRLAVLNQSTTAILDQSTTAILDTSMLPAAFGHGTMVAGVVHLTAPAAKIMPLKAFTADGAGDLSAILRAIYYAADNGASVINMSFSLPDGSLELQRAINYAQDKSCISVASTGNTGLPSVAFPAAAAKVIGVASTDLFGNRSTFSSFGPPTWVAAPGETIVTTYPGNHWAVASGTSFSAPFISGGTSMLKQFAPLAGYSNISKAFSGRKKYAQDLGYGVPDLYQAAAWIKAKE